MRKIFLILALVFGMAGFARAQQNQVLSAAGSLFAQIGLKATATAHSVTLTYSEAPGQAGTVNFNVYRAALPAGPFTVISSATNPGAATTYVDSTVTAASNYTYQVTAFYNPCPPQFTSCPETVPSNQISVAIPNPGTPAVPTGLSGAVAVNHVGTQDQIVATWQDVPGVPTFYVLFNKTKGYVQMNGAPAVNTTGNYTTTYTGSPFNGNFAICDANSTCMILNFLG